MTAATDAPPAKMPDRAATLRLLPFVAIVFLGFSTIGVSLAALPLQVGGVLGYGAVVVGVTVALQSISTLATRPLGGEISDTRGGKTSVLMGMASFVAAGFLYLVSAWVAAPLPSLTLLALGRMLAGFGESAIVTGSLSWAIAIVGPAHTGRSMVWVGIAMFGAIAVGAPLGLALFGYAGFAAVAWAAIVAPTLAGALTLILKPRRAAAGPRLPFSAVVGLVWRQGAGLALASVGYGGAMAFTSLMYGARGWDGAGLALTAFGGAYILARLFFGHLPDKIGGQKPAIVSACCEVAGLAVIALATDPRVAMAGAFFAGAGFSMVFPSLGSLAMKNVPPASRGAALGAYVAFLDIGIGLSGPIIGAIIAGFGFSAAYAFAAVAAALVVLVARGERQVPR
jgi:MFS family permease